MKIFKTIFFSGIFMVGVNWAQSQTVYSTCNAAAAGTPLTNGQCINNFSFSGSANMAGLCVGGTNPSVFIPFTAGSCVQFNFNPDATASGDIGIRIVADAGATCGAQVGFSTCVGGVTNNADFTWSENFYNSSLNAPLTSGTNYVMQIWGVPNGQWDLCYSASVTEATNNECIGATGLSATGATFYNGGFCAYSGSNNDATTSDLAASESCAGSLENTQWVTFSPTAGATSFQIIGSSILCVDGACAYQFGIFSGNCGSLTSEGCVSNGNPCASGPDPNTSINENATDGYSIVWSGTSATGFTATITRSNGAAFTGTEKFYLAMDGNSGSDCTYNLTGVNIQPLPMELMSFTGRMINKVNRLEWEVASETNNDYFEIERSLDAEIWYSVAKVEGAGTSTSQTKYTLLDQNPIKGLGYYRLKQVDFDGQESYSRVITINRPNERGDVVKRLDLMGREVTADFTGIMILFYENGEIEKVQVQR